MKDTAGIERDKMILEVELQDQTAPVEFKFNDERIKTSERIEIKNLGGGKHQLIFNKLEMGDAGTVTCESGKLSSTCTISVQKGESKPAINFPSQYEAPAIQPFVVEVPFKGK